MEENQRQDRRQSHAEALFTALVFCILAVVMVGVGLQGWLPPLASRHGSAIDRTLLYLLGTVGLMFLVGHLVLAYLIWRFSRQSQVTLRMASPKVERNWSIALGIVMTLVAEGGVLAIGLPAWSEYFGSAPPEDALTIEVTAEQFAWNVRYPGADGVFGRTEAKLIDTTNPIGIDPADPAAGDDLTAINQIHVPVDQPVRIRLRAKDVIHSFFLPELRVKQDAVPGMTIDIWFVPTEEGRFEIACTELCGLGHYRMKGFFNVLESGEFDRWLSEASS